MGTGCSQTFTLRLSNNVPSARIGVAVQNKNKNESNGMFVKSVFSVLLVCVLLSACSGQNGPVLVTDRMKIDKAKCSQIEKDMSKTYTVVAAREAGIRRIKKTAKYRKMLKEDAGWVRDYMDKLKRDKIEPHIKKYRKFEDQYKALCGGKSRKIAQLKTNYPSEFLR